jgi:hypothetical protein
MSAAGRQVQCRKASNTGIPSADLDTVPSLLEGKTVPAMESKISLVSVILCTIKCFPNHFLS